ncbi:midasin [Lojkania enalia]|uniref:Midasin n=1 Tax=Lojkania enalia TaxID=147567 RepID=A0A9P4K1A0_9PLEO|nr:midasin [Didymosphaeria enalia]
MDECDFSLTGETVTFDSLATQALEPQATDDLFVQYHGLFVEICARWMTSDLPPEIRIAAFGRIVPLAPWLAGHAERFLLHSSQSPLLGMSALGLNHFSSESLQILLLGAFRLLSYDCRTFSSYVRPQVLRDLFQHDDKVVRYLAVRTFCLYIRAADYATQEMIKTYVSEEGEITGDWEGQAIDYRFLSLWEEKRWKLLKARLRKTPSKTIESINHEQLSPHTAHISGILLPRLNDAAPEEKPGEIITTATTESNLRNIASALLDTRPILLTGLPGSGKTLLTRHFAWQLNKLNSMVTLHLNEQSDAKLLIGMYATGSKPGTFSWRPGVLTTAVREGRWIFIEDLDRAPNEVISTLLPLIERGELLIPSRGETIRAARGFQIIATMRSTLNPHGQEFIPRQNMIGHRFWNTISVCMPGLGEFQEIISIKYPALRNHLEGIMKVYSRLLEYFSDAKFWSENGTSLRALTPRDLLKWCDRIAVLLSESSSFNQAQVDNIFMEAMDCFSGSLRSEQARLKVMACVAEELHINPQRRDHLLVSREVKFEVPYKSNIAGAIRIGRVRLAKHKSSRKTMPSRPFSTNKYTLRLLEKIAVAVDRQEPLLLVGETGTGKTTCIQFLADQLGRKLVPFNLSQQSDSGDLLGGYKPVNVRNLVIPLKDEFDDLFDSTFSRKKNVRFLEMLGKRVAKGEWKRVCILWREALKMVAAVQPRTSPDLDSGQPKKKRKVDSLPSTLLKARWDKFGADLSDLEAQLASGPEAFAFSFLEGNIIKAVRNGDWVLLDEINLASSDTLEALADLFGGGPDGSPSILLTETGNVKRLVAHPNFRVFAAMNPATDVGKKDLPSGIRSRFTELYVESPDSDIKSLRNIVEKYIGGQTNDPAVVKVAMDVTNLYLDIQHLAKSNMLVDGADQTPHFSLRTLTRTLSYAREIAPLCTLRRALYEGFQMSFLTFLDKASEDLVAPLIRQHLFSQKSSMKAELGRLLSKPTDGRDYVRQGHYWLRRGSHPVKEESHYIITPFVRRNMNNLIRAASTRQYPVLIQGPTSSGKTSMIEYLAKRSGNKFVRINNHEHTDLQEYLGSYISGTDGNLQFQEGILVRALREGHWIVLDELNLAPTDVLEALNRLLDDNRELLIPETQEVVRPHEDFMLFATQNPAGLYGGRKVLSRAFRNRFLELHFDDIPVEELTEILHRRTMIPESWCKRIVKVYQELSTLRQENRLFEQKSFATLRDLFRWAQRKADTVQDLAMNGYMLLAERVRKEEERQAVKKIIETEMSKNGPRVIVNEEILYSEDTSPEIKLYKGKMGNANVVWTRAMRRLFVLVVHAIRNNEPVLLVGETGCGKTTVCQMLADAFDKQLHIVNAHQNTETGDLIGAQRPIRNRAVVEDLLRRQLLSVLGGLTSHVNLLELNLKQLLNIYDKLDQSASDKIPEGYQEDIRLNRIKVAALFEWADGSLVHAMRTGQFFLLDEISLADDSVLERLNSVLESSRTMLLAEKGPIDSLITASDGFQFLATMNPGGDYGKKELSPALRNRFTEIWVPALSDVEDIHQIVQSKLRSDVSQHASSLVSFAQWFNDKYNTSVTSSISIRDTLAWVIFINNLKSDDPIFSIVHGAAMVFIDTLGANPAGLLAISPATIDEERKACLYRLSKLLGKDVAPLYFADVDVITAPELLQLGQFSIPRFTTAAEDAGFSFDAPTTRSNAMRVIRALQLPKPILLEGNPGVGKTTLITAIAKVTGKPLARLNLSEQTDLMDLFGSDVPVEGGQAGTFAWRDAPFLKAMKNGEWVLLDEMNLASQSVLEGLNAVLDHRGEVYISELDQTFHKHRDFRVFAAQNPHHQGGGRKGLPASFVNRFTVVYTDVFHLEDLSLICRKVFPSIEPEEIQKLITFVATVDEQVVTRNAFGALGAPWEFNLRDTIRWLQLLASKYFLGSARDFLDTVFVQRFRTQADRNRLLKLFDDVYGEHEPRISLYHNLAPTCFQVGLGILPRDTVTTRPGLTSHLQIPQLSSLEALLISVKQNWPVILVGPPGSGKTSILNQLASLVGADLTTFAMNADIDAMDLVGGYEQADPSREIHRCLAQLDGLLRKRIAATKGSAPLYIKALELLNSGLTQISDEFLGLLSSAVQLGQDSHDLALLLEELSRLSQSSAQIEGARFQWVDGILIQALEQGKWLVLDNANLCSSAVLDRLNSLLEPNGYLSINEHSTADGEARIVRPHSDFRIFLTMDPRYGELSRAMRNRAVEICLLSSEKDAGKEMMDESLPSYLLESQMYRFRHFCGEEDSLANTIDIRFEYLSLADHDLIQSFRAEASKGLVPIYVTAQRNGISTESSNDLRNCDIVVHGNISSRLAHLPDFFTNIWSDKSLHFQNQLGNLIAAEQLQVLPYHPLSHELYVHANTSSQSLSLWHASYYCLFLDLHDMLQALRKAPSIKFERHVEKQKLPQFLYSFWEALNAWAEATWNTYDPSRARSSPVEPLKVLFWAFLQLSSGSWFDRATFQTHLQILNEKLQSLPENCNSMVALRTTLFRDLTIFAPNVQLETGLGMERIWRHFKPDTPKTLEQLKAILVLECLADRLDASMWKSNLDVDEIIQIRERFASSLQLVKTTDIDAAELISILESAVHDLEAQIDKEDTAETPYFENVFEGLCQFSDVFQSYSNGKSTDLSDAVRMVRAKSALFARRPTKSFTTEITNAPPQFLSSLYRFIGIESHSGQEIALRGTFHVATLEKLAHADEVPLSQLDRFESELQVLSQHISLHAQCITNDQHNVLSASLKSRVDEILASQSDLVNWDGKEIKFSPGVQVSEQYRVALNGLGRFQTQFTYVLDSSSMAQAWIDLALLGLYLYIPNYPFDPALRPIIERKMFNEQKATLAEKLQALRAFQVGFAGQDTSFRIRLLQQKIEDMGSEPPIAAIVRPEVSELDALQGEFTNLLSIVQPLQDGSLDYQNAGADKTLRQNLTRIIQRLKGGYRAYEDITAPAVGFLTFLLIGLTLSPSIHKSESIQRSLNYLSCRTPFLGFHQPRPWSDSETAQSYPEQFLWHALGCLSLIRSVDPAQVSNDNIRSLIHSIFSSFYSEWKNKLQEDQKKEAKNTSLYTYRGEDQDDDEGDPDIFPDYETEQVVSPRLSSTSHEHAIRLANMHAEIFLIPKDASELIKRLLEWCSNEMVLNVEGKAHGTSYMSALPTIFIALGKKYEALSSTGTNKAYNFYFDANLTEAKRLVHLVHKIQQRYRQIRRVWPEHAALSEVLRTCDEALAFRHVDPVAKFITKAEKLHGYMHEWQRVASREFGTANLYDDLTKLLVSWRQLELTTWARLFDIEMEKCRDDAKSWFFVVYETIIVASESLRDEMEMKTYAKNLLKTLEGFFSTTTFGQYEERIRLLQQIREHIAIRVRGDEMLKLIQLALDNFIAYFSRLINSVHEAVTKGRQALEKDVNNVIKLASWKDTNIETLKQNARTSHRKLSKLVKKFRALLNQPVSGIYAAGFPNRQLASVEVGLPDVNTDIPTEVIAICERSIPGWIEKPTRFKNLGTTISIMRKKSRPGPESIDGAAYVDSFIVNLEVSITQLQEATPSTLTEENKEIVQHLKTRKRKLYADTMKELRQMGFQSNLSSDVLVTQDELSTILAGLPSVQGPSGNGSDISEYFLHKSLNIMSQVRSIAKEHSRDLTGNDVARSIGYLEGILNATIRQRGMLNYTSQTLSDLEAPISQIKNLAASNQVTLTAISEDLAENAEKMHVAISWLAVMLKTGADILCAQAKLGRTTEFSGVVQGLRYWGRDFQNLAADYANFPTLPTNIWSVAHARINQQIVQKTAEFYETFNGWLEDYPLARPTLQHLRPYIIINSSSVEHSCRPKSSVFDKIDLVLSKNLFGALDLILGAMQDVEAAMKNIPASTEDTAWLKKEEQAIGSAISALHAPHITGAIRNILDQMQYLDDDNVRSFAALFTAVLPILDQYHASHKYLVDKFEAVHFSTTRLLYRLAKSFIQLGSQGFCTPPEKSSDQQTGKDEKLEGGTGLGEGEGAEDISKDIGEDEDLEDLAQEKGGERKGSVEEEEDAIDMGKQEMEGEMENATDKEDQGSKGGEGDEDVESEAESVDDLGPSVVDEKIWDEGGKDDDAKDKEGKQGVGTEDQNEQVAAEENKDEGKRDDGLEKEKQRTNKDEMEMEGEDQEEIVGVGETEQMDPHAREEETLDLPDELNMDGNDEDKEDYNLSDMDIDEMGSDELDVEPGAEPDTVDEDIGPEEEGEDKDTTGHIQDEEDTSKEQESDREGEEPVDDDMVPLPDEQTSDQTRNADEKNQADTSVEAGAGMDTYEEAQHDENKQASASAANQKESTEGEMFEQRQESRAQDGTLSQTAQPEVGKPGQEAEESPEKQSFRKLGDALEKWYNKQQQISDAAQRDESQMKQIDQDVDIANADFEHLQDEHEQGDAQALGTATEEQAKALDHDMAMAVNEKETVPAAPEDEDEQGQDSDQDVDMEDPQRHQEEEQQQPSTDSRPQAFVGEQTPFAFHDEDQDVADASRPQEELSETSSIHKVEAQLQFTHLDATALSPGTARDLWLYHELTTHSLSQQLTEHLRLILAPTLATKLRGDFRTGKRLNLKRIIPYIASSYKRDKIWLRRSMPSKRNYQVMIALDDSRSMKESGVENLALKTLTLVTRSLSMLEVGEVSVVGFGDHVTVAHSFDKPFTSESGVRVFEQFGFQAAKTNVRGLLERSLSIFSESRHRGASYSGEDLWQLMLIVSDGICDSHAEIQRLVRRAEEQRVMIVFIIIDSSTPASQLSTSILDLQSVEVLPEGKVIRWKYMERFPFRYYLVVQDVKELPSVLAGALRQWFGEVAGSI